ncbi:PMS1 protein homolog 1 [Gastrophryne carolinensis]
MHHLSSETIRLLSSSQVITSVVSVVKELLENALDANSNSITIKLDNYGFDKIEVQDNGEGIKASDVPVMGISHYTSKIASHEDLESLKTYGFRGEALGSICSVAEVHITTKTAADEISTQYVLDSTGHIISQKPSHLGQGTTVTVSNLFKNLPVRKQYFSTTKKCKAELKKIQDLLMAYGIIKPDVRTSLVHNKMIIWQKNKVSDHKMALMSILGNSVMNSMVPFQHLCNDSEITISGFLPAWDANRSLTSASNSERSWIFINQRPVYHKEILKMVRLYYCQDTSSLCYPVFFMNIIVRASDVDVNITPDKTQVMFQNKEFVLSAVEGLLKSLYPDPVLNKVHKMKALPTEAEKEISCAISTQICSKDRIIETTDALQLNTDTSVTKNELESQILTCLKDPLESSVSGSNSQKNVTVERLKDLPNCAMPLMPECGIQSDCAANTNAKRVKNSGKVDSDKSNSSSQLTECKDFTSSEDLETSNNDWSKGHSFKNAKGENLQPFKILTSSGVNNDKKMLTESSVIESTGNTAKNSTSVIFDKTGFISAFDLIGDQVVKKPKSAVEIFTQKYRMRSFENTPVVGANSFSSDILDMWEQLGEEEKHKYEEEATKDFQRYKAQIAKATEKKTQKSEKKLRLTSSSSPAPKTRLKTPFSNQQILDTLFKSQAEKKVPRSTVKTVQVTFNLNLLKQRCCRNPFKQTSEAGDYRLLSKLDFPGAWVVASETKISLMNPYRIEEALLYKRLVESHKIGTETLDPPINLTERLLGTSDYLTVLLGMQDSPKPSGHFYLSDLRLVANGFLIKIIPGASDVDNHIEIEGMATSLPFYGISDLKEILDLVKYQNSKELYDCRPLKVLNYLEGEAVRLSRQLPLNLSKDDVNYTLNRMAKHLASETKGCIHGRPFLFNLADIPKCDD